MDTGLDLNPVAPEQRSASTLDVALLFAGANVVSSTLITGATLGQQGSLSTALFALLTGCVVGTMPLALLARLGPRTGLPSMVLLRRPFGTVGAAAISLLLVVTNFAWIALNNQVAASAFGALRAVDASGAEVGPGDPLGALLVGAIAVAVAAFGPAAMARFDRIAVPLMALVGVALTVAVARSGAAATALPKSAGGGLAPMVALDLVVGYQVSWALMFADYTRYQRTERSASRSVFFGLSLTSVWLMGIGLVAGRWVGSNDPATLLVGVGLPGVTLLALGLATITTNFVNIYLSSLAVRTLWPKVPALPTVLVIGAIGTLLSVADPTLLDRYAGFMGWLATLLLPIAAIALVHWFLPGRAPTSKNARRRPAPPLQPAALIAWFFGALIFQWLSGSLEALGSIGSTGARLGATLGASLPTLLATAAAYGWSGSFLGGSPDGAPDASPGGSAKEGL